MKQASSTGASVTIAFTGTGLDWIARKGTSSGIARVTLDGTTPVTVDLYNSSTLYKQKVWSSGPLTSGAHTVKIKYTGTKRSASHQHRRQYRRAGRGGRADPGSHTHPLRADR